MTYRPRPTTVNDIARSAAASSCSPVGDVRESGAGFLGRRVLQGEALEFSQGGIDRGNSFRSLKGLGSHASGWESAARACIPASDTAEA